MALQLGRGDESVTPSGWLPKPCEYHGFMQTVLDECTHICLCRFEFMGSVGVLDVRRC